MLVCVGVVVPWLRTPARDLWAWDVSVLWAMTGNVEVVAAPPSIGFVTLVCAAVCVVAALRPAGVGGAMAAAAAGFVIGVGVLSVVRGLSFAGGSVRPHVGLVVATAGGVLAAVGTLLDSD